MTSDFLAHFLTYLPTHVRFCPITGIHFSILCPIFANLPTYPKIGRHMWTAPKSSCVIENSIKCTMQSETAVSVWGRPRMTSDFWVGR